MTAEDYRLLALLMTPRPAPRRPDHPLRREVRRYDRAMRRVRTLIREEVPSCGS